jgi:ABC-type antimicrobial peptide transport system permease subunit
MKNLGNFLVGSLSSFGVAQALPDTVQTVGETSANVINSVEALVSLISGILSALLLAWIKRKLEKKALPKE